MGDVKDFKGKKKSKGNEVCNEVVVPLLEQRDIQLVKQGQIKASCVVLHGRQKEHFDEFAVVGIQDGTLTAIAMMRLPDLAVAIDKLYDVYTSGMEQLPIEKRIDISSEVRKLLGR